MKKNLIALFLALVSVFALAFVGCDNKKEDDKKEETKATITLSSTDITVEMFDTAVLSATVKDGEGSVTWSSENTAIATVGDDGTITGVAVGETKVKATLGDVSESCIVTVVKSSVLPIVSIEYSDLSLYVEDVYTFEVSTTWKNKAVDVTYAWAKKEGEDDFVTIATGTENGKFNITAVKAGIAHYTLSATAVGETIYKDITITVTEPTYTLSITGPTKSGDSYAYTLKKEPDDATGTATFTATASRNDDELDSSRIVWSSDNESIATVENGVVTGKAVGSANITVSVKRGESVVKSMTIALTVKNKVYKTITYKDTDTTTTLYTESVEEGTAAKYVNKNFPDDGTLGDYTLEYNNCSWLDSNGKIVSLDNVTEDKTVFAAYGYMAYQTFNLTPSEDHPDTAINKAFTAYGTYAKIDNYKASLSFRAGQDKTQIAFMEIATWTEPITYTCEANVWYTFVIEFEQSTDSSTQYTLDGVRAYVLNEDGEIVAQASAEKAALYHENFWAYVKMPYTGEKSNPQYLSSGTVDIGAQVNVKNSYTVTYVDANNNVVGTEKVAEGSSATCSFAGEDGYTIAYENATFVDSTGATVSLDNITKDLQVKATSGTKLTYISGESGQQKVITDYNKYISFDADGDVVFKVKLNESVASATFAVFATTQYEETTRTPRWDDSHTWYTVKVVGSTGVVTIIDVYGNEVATKTYTNYSKDTLSLRLDQPYYVAAVETIA